MSELKLPELGENIEEALVSSVLVSVGDVVRPDQPVIEVETEKASLEVPADTGGKIAEVRVEAGQKIKVGAVILVVEAEGAAAAAPEPRADEPEPAAAEPAPAPPKEPAAAGEKFTPAPGPAPVVEFPSRPAAAEAATPARLGEPVPAAPSVRALARELGVDIRTVPGSGAGGRISRADVKAHAKRLIGGQAQAAAPAAPQETPPLPDFARWGQVRREPLSGLRRAAARNLSRSWALVPHVTQFDRADVTQLESMRRKFNQRPEAEGQKLSVTAMVLKLAAAALGRFPRFNASLDLEAEQIVLKQFVHIGVAADTERGLVVPVVRDVDKKRLLDLSVELGALAGRAREGKLTLDEMQGATFTISNLGGLGTTYFSPIVNWPEVAILGVGRAEMQAVPTDNGFEARRILPLSLSYDHRLIDGADAARFLRWIAEGLEQPLILLLDAPAE